MPQNFAHQVIDKAQYGVVSMIDKDKSYSVPLSIVRSGDLLYFHSAKQGRKVDVLANNANVTVVFVGDKCMPENYSPNELEQMNSDALMAVKLISNVFTTEFESTIVTGVAKLVDDEDEKIGAMFAPYLKKVPSDLTIHNVYIEKKILIYRLVTKMAKKYL